MSSEKPHYLEHRQRLRERFLKGGTDALQEYEQLELLLTYAIPRRDVKPIAKALIDRFGSVAAVFDAPVDALQEVSGIGENSAVMLRLVRELGSVYLSQRLSVRAHLDCSADVADFARSQLADRANETFMVIYLDIQNRVLGHELLGEGTVDRVVIYPRRILEAALKQQAAGLILVHNHPSGAVEPSSEDVRMTHDLQQTARSLDIEVLDHLIVSTDGWYSLAEAGKM